jgi:hypothetical protein
MHVQLQNYDFEGANSGSDGGWELCETLKQMLDPLTNNVISRLSRGNMSNPTVSQFIICH